MTPLLKVLNAKLPPQLASVKSLQSLLAKEKRRRRVPQSQLVFVGMHNIAQFWWCGMYAVRKSREKELELFQAYLADRLSYATALGFVTSMPRTQAAILEAGSQVTFNAVHSLFEPLLRISTKTPAASRSEELNLSHWPAEDLEIAVAEHYPRFRWHFEWRTFVVVGIPDGVTSEFVYEFKTAGNQHWFETASRPIGNTQADLYGLFFEKPKKRLQVLIRDSGEVVTLAGDTDQDRAVQTLERFHSVERGEYPQPPKAFKCRSCEVAQGCPIRQA